MPKSKFTSEQKSALLKLYRQGADASEICRMHNITKATLLAWRRQAAKVYDGVLRQRLISAKRVAAEQAFVIRQLRIQLAYYTRENAGASMRD